jgi:hypothetical protein
MSASLLVSLLIAAVSAAAPGAAQGSPDDHALALECRGALWKLAFDEATAAGLNPGAVVTGFEAGKARRSKDGALLVFRGREPYEPTTDVAPFPIEYECRVDPRTRQVVSVTYTAVDATGARIARAPTDLVKDARVVDACRQRLVGRIGDEAERKGATDASAQVEIDPASVAFTPKSGTIDLAGRGRARFGDAFAWQALDFTCRYDERKRQATKSTHDLEVASAVDSLQPEARDAVAACRAAVEAEILEGARKRGYLTVDPRLDGRERRRERRDSEPVIDIPSLPNVKTQGDRIEVSGKGQFKVERRHAQPTPMTFICVYDRAAGRVASSQVTLEEGGWTPSGEVASGVTDTMRCESRYGAHQQCRARIKGGVKIVREFGRAPCEAYRNWIWSLEGVTVWGDCAAEFEFEVR